MREQNGQNDRRFYKSGGRFFTRQKDIHLLGRGFGNDRLSGIRLSQFFARGVDGGRDHGHGNVENEHG